MNKYELALVLNPSLDEEAKTEAFNKVQDLITRFGGTIEKIDDWGKRRLAYEIKKVNELLPPLPLKSKAVFVSWKTFYVTLLSVKTLNCSCRY